MLGVYNYTVILTYLSIISASIGILVSLHGDGHPFFGVFFLLLSGLFDAFDGRVARCKKDRTDIEKNYGIQIDSLSDIVAFGVLPICIGDAMVRSMSDLSDIPFTVSDEGRTIVYPLLFFAVSIFYVTAALIRLAWFNVTEEERQKKEAGARKIYQGLPVTSAAIIFPTALLLQFLSMRDLTLLYYGCLAVTGLLFISKIPILKPGLRGILIMVGIGAAEFAMLIYALFFIN